MFYGNKPNPGWLNGSPKHFPQSWYPLFPRAVATNYHKLGGLKQHKLTVLKPQSPKPRCWQGYAPSRHSREECFLASSGFWWLLLTLGIPCFVASLQSLPLSSHGVLPGYRFLLIDTLLDEDPPSSTMTLILTWLHLQRSYFQIRSHLLKISSGSQYLKVPFGGTQFNPPHPQRPFMLTTVTWCQFLRPQRYQQQYLQHYNTTKQQYLLSTKCYFTRIFLLILKYSVK